MTTLDAIKALAALQTHAKKGNVKETVALSDDGKTLTFKDGEETLTADALVKTTVYDVCNTEYSLLTLYLFLTNKEVIDHRNACKKHSVDPVKVLDRGAFQGFFAMGDGSSKSNIIPNRDGKSASKSKKLSSSSSKSKDRERERERARKHGKSSGSGKKDEKEKDRRHASSSILTEEKMLANLNIVADKRSIGVSIHFAGNADSGSGVKEIKTDGEDANSDEVPNIPQEKPSDARDVLNDLSFLSAVGFDVPDVETLEADRKLVKKITAAEIPLNDSASILRAWDTRNLTRVLELFNENQKPNKHSSSGKKRPTVPSSSSRSADQVNKRLKKTSTGLPVIIVPTAISSPITMINAGTFFKESKFIPADVMKKGGSRKPNLVKFERQMVKCGNKNVQFEVVDNPHVRFGRNRLEWDRVVAVVAQGAEWQFKGWHLANPVEIFSKTFGFYISMEGDPIPPSLRGWNVKQGKLNRDKRGLDSVTYASFWNNLEEWMVVHKPEYLPEA